MVGNAGEMREGLGSDWVEKRWRRGGREGTESEEEVEERAGGDVC